MKEFESCEKCKYRDKSDYEYPCERCVHGCIVKEYYESMTNADRIRAMSDEELAELLYSLQYCDEKVKFCRNNKECDDILGGGGTIPDEMCKQCLVWWLQSEVEE